MAVGLLSLLCHFYTNGSIMIVWLLLQHISSQLGEIVNDFSHLDTCIAPYSITKLYSFFSNRAITFKF